MVHHKKMKEGDFTTQELEKVLRHSQNNKTPGPNECTAEQIKWLDEEHKEILLKELNNIRQGTKKYPESLTTANDSQIYKKGDSQCMENYRPVALLQTFYKILAQLLKFRTMDAHDELIDKADGGEFVFEPSSRL